jgi:hypothetical protein
MRVSISGQRNQSIGQMEGKNFPPSVGKILLVPASAWAYSSSQISTRRVPVVAPAGSVLRVRLDQALDTERSRPGERFTNGRDSALKAVLKSTDLKGTIVMGHVLNAPMFSVRPAGHRRCHGAPIGRRSAESAVVAIAGARDSGKQEALAAESSARLTLKYALKNALVG